MHTMELTQSESLRFYWRSFSRTLNDASRFMKVKVAELSKKPKTLDHPQAASLGLSLVCAWIAVHRLSEVKPTDNVLVIGKLKLLFRALSVFTVWQALEVGSALGSFNCSKTRA